MARRRPEPALLTMGKRHWSDPSEETLALLASVRNPEPEPRPHVCGACRTPWGVTNPECPGRNKSATTA